MKKVLIVKEGQWGFVPPRSYQQLIDDYVRVLSGPEEKKTVVEVVPTAGEAEEKIQREDVSVVIFISRSMEDVAEGFAAMFPWLKVIVLTGLIPSGKVIWVNKFWVSNPETLRKIVLQG